MANCWTLQCSLYPADRQMGNHVTQAEIQGFSNCVHDLVLNELPWKGEYYTWTNKQQGDDQVCSRIDRCFENYEWMMKWGHILAKYDVPNISDHVL